MRTISIRLLAASALAALISGCVLPPDAYYDNAPATIVHGHPTTIYRSGPIYVVPDRHDERAWLAHERREQKRAHMLRERMHHERDREQMHRERAHDPQRAQAERQRAHRDDSKEQRRMRRERSQDQGGDR